MVTISWNLNTARWLKTKELPIYYLFFTKTVYSETRFLIDNLTLLYQVKSFFVGCNMIIRKKGFSALINSS